MPPEPDESKSDATKENSSQNLEKACARVKYALPSPGTKPYKSTHAGPCSCKVGGAVSTCTAVGLSWRGTVPKQESRMAERSR